MHCSQFISYLIFIIQFAQFAAAQRNKYIKRGEDVNFACVRKGAKLIRISDDNGYIYLLIQGEKPQPIQGEWNMDLRNGPGFTSNSADLALRLTLPKFNASKETTIRCEDEQEKGFELALRELVPPEIQLTSDSGSNLVPPDSTLIAKCVASGGKPTPAIKWTDSMGNIYDTNSPQVSQILADGNIESTLRLSVNRDFDAEQVSCEVRQALNIAPITRSLPQLAIDYAPTAADVSVEAVYVGDYLRAKCRANGRPTPTIEFLIDERVIADAWTYSVGEGDKTIKCRATNRHGQRESQPLRLLLVPPTPQPPPPPSPTPIATIKPAAITATQSLNSDSNRASSTQSDAGATMNASLSSGGPSESNYISAANNITISCVAVGILCTAVIIGIMVRRKLRYKAETYRTDVAAYDEGTAFQDPELEAKFKKEYFM